MKSFFALAILSTIAAPAMAETFTRDGQTYDYKMSSIGEATLISGTNLSTGEKFSLKVSGTRVKGQYGFSAVDFGVAEVATAARASGAMMAAK